MAQRWRVYKDNQDLGLMTSAEIRQALRDGVVDPFDLVSREGSSLKVELVEVDEIFDPRYQEPVAQAAPVAAAQPQQQAAPMVVNAPPPASAPYVPSPLESITSSSFAATPGGETATGRKRRAAAKKFYLVDRRGRVLGPLSAGEIQSLYQRGIVEKGVRVQKVGEPKSIPLNLFISAYAGERMMALGASNNDIRQAPGVTALKSSKVLNELYMTVSTEGAGKGGLTRYFGIILVGVFLGLLVFFSLNFEDTDTRKRTASRERPVRERASPTLKRIPEQRPRRQVAARPKESEEPRAAAPQRRPAVAQSRPTPPANRSKPPRAVASNRAPAAPKRSAAISLRDGEIATLNNLEFSKVDLEDCPLKCRLPFFLEGRRVITAVFFKGAFEDKLRATRGSVTIRGNVKNEADGFVLFLQDVR